MKIVNTNPPNYEQLATAFPFIKTEPHMLYAYGDTIYNPGGKEVPQWKITHEQVHGAQQLDVGVDWWWGMYIESKTFRYDEEVPAHQMDYKAFCEIYKDRNERAKYLHFLAGQLSGPLYGNLVSLDEAKRVIKNETRG